MLGKISEKIACPCPLLADVNLACCLQVILFSEGFRQGKALGRKLVAVFNLSRELLTPQQHYDWGLRALKTVLRGSGQALHALRRKNDADDTDGKASLCKLFFKPWSLRRNTWHWTKMEFATLHFSKLPRIGWSRLLAFFASSAAITVHAGLLALGPQPGGQPGNCPPPKFSWICFVVRCNKLQSFFLPPRQYQLVAALACAD